MNFYAVRSQDIILNPGNLWSQFDGDSIYLFLFKKKAWYVWSQEIEGNTWKTITCFQTLSATYIKQDWVSDGERRDAWKADQTQTDTQTQTTVNSAAWCLELK